MRMAIVNYILVTRRLKLCTLGESETHNRSEKNCTLLTSRSCQSVSIGIRRNEVL
jgi:hypothetical protein